LWLDPLGTALTGVARGHIMAQAGRLAYCRGQ
jgi:hypothetical protein